MSAMNESSEPVKCYYAHPICFYDTEFETTVIEQIEAAGFTAINPNAPEHQAGYKTDGMDYFLDLCRGCSACVFQALPCGCITAGVAKEVESFLARGLPVYRTNLVDLIRVSNMSGHKILSVKETRELLAAIAA